MGWVGSVWGGFLTSRNLAELGEEGEGICKRTSVETRVDGVRIYDDIFFFKTQSVRHISRGFGASFFFNQRAIFKRWLKGSANDLNQKEKVNRERKVLKTTHRKSCSVLYSR